MRCERLCARQRVKCWERRIGDRLDGESRALDPGQEINPRLFPNDPGEARSEPVTSYRSLARPFTPRAGLRLPPTGGC